MNTPSYIEISFNNVSLDQSDMLIALLNDLGFEGFEEGDTHLKAYINENNYNENAFVEVMHAIDVTYQVNTIQSQNWNAVWEEQFEPVVVNDFVGIRAHFHPSFAGKVQHEIVITPKMSFGTGHHATTWMMIDQMQHLNLKDKQVLDFGTGTGILAILSEKLGAKQVLAIDIDEWSIENANENVARNGCTAITLQLADKIDTTIRFDVILANINKNVILQNMQPLINCLQTNGVLLLSGLLAEDENDILAAIKPSHLKHQKTVQRNQWIAMFFAG